MSDDELKSAFMAFCKFSDPKNKGTMSDSKFKKMVKDAGLYTKKFSANDCSLIFAGSKTKGKNVITFDQFKAAAEKVAARRYPKKDDKAGHAAVWKALIGANASTTNTTKGKVAKSLEQNVGSMGQKGQSNKDASKDLSALADRSVKTDARGVPITATEEKKESSKKKGKAKATLATVSKDDADKLKPVFEAFCMMGSKSNDPNAMVTSKFSKILADSKIKGMQTSSGIIFSAVAGKQKKITFDQFLEALPRVAKDKYGEGNDTNLGKITSAIIGAEVTTSGTTTTETLSSGLTEKTGVYARGGPTNVDAPKDLGSQLRN